MVCISIPSTSLSHNDRKVILSQTRAYGYRLKLAKELQSHKNKTPLSGQHCQLANYPFSRRCRILNPCRFYSQYVDGDSRKFAMGSSLAKGEGTRQARAGLPRISLYLEEIKLHYPYVKDKHGAANPKH